MDLRIHLIDKFVRFNKDEFDVNYHNALSY